MLGHIRSGNLDRFKKAFDNALNEGKGFAVAARDCIKYFMSQFDEESAGTVTGPGFWCLCIVIALYPDAINFYLEVKLLKSCFATITGFELTLGK